GFSGLQVALRVGIPVFIAPMVPATHRLEWSARLLPEGIRLVAENNGNAHVQVTDFELRAVDAAEPVAHESTLAYVLAGQRREWTFPAPADSIKSATELKLKAFTDAGEVDIPVRLDR